MSEEKKMVVTDEMCIAKWRALLAMFHKTIQGNPEPETVKDKLEMLRNTASSSIELTPRQVEGISTRVSNYLNGEYGKTKTDENFGHGKVIPATNGKH